MLFYRGHSPAFFGPSKVGRMLYPADLKQEYIMDSAKRYRVECISKALGKEGRNEENGGRIKAAETGEEGGKEHRCGRGRLPSQYHNQSRRNYSPRSTPKPEPQGKYED